MSDHAPAKRHYVLESYEDDSGAVSFPREQTLALLQDLEAVLMAVGGTVTIAAQRAKYREISGHPVAETVRLVAEWRAFSPLPLEDLTGGPQEAAGDAADEDAAGAGAPAASSASASAPPLPPALPPDTVGEEFEDDGPDELPAQPFMDLEVARG